MKKLTNYLFLLLLTVTFVGISSCDKSESTPNSPIITPPNTVTEVQAGQSTDINFSVNVPGGYLAGGASAITGSAVIKTDLAPGATSGNIVVTYTAGNGSGGDAVSLSVTDKSNQTITNSAPITVTGAPTQKPNVVLAGIIKSDSTLTADRIWELSGRVILDDGVTMTIEPGTIVKGREGTGTNASALIVSRGAKIMAEGTASKPIIFTATLDNIKLGEKAGTNLKKIDNEKWGGLIMLGKAPISAKDGDTESSIEGLPANEPYAKYGGNVSDDNSGVLKYVSIRHGGVTIGEGNEINGLTLGGVGSGTTIEDLEIYATLDDGVEFFGGTVNIKNVLVAWQGDDGLDIDQNYAGTAENFVVTHGELVGTDEGLEVDGPEGSTNVDGLFTLKNGTIFNDGKEGTPGDFKSKAQGTVQNIKFVGYTTAQIKIAASYTNNCMDASTDAFTHLTAATPTLIFTGSNFDSNKVYTKSKSDDGVTTCTVPQADQDAADAKMISDSNATGADMSVFDWTLAKSEGLIP